jgi:hypothetical protein
LLVKVTWPLFLKIKVIGGNQNDAKLRLSSMEKALLDLTRFHRHILD